MLKSNKKNLVLNSSVMLHEHIEAEGKGRKFVSRFIEAGVAHYQEFGDILITKETLDKFVHTMVGCPVIINHKDITDKNADDERVGVVSNVWYNECDGWYYCDGIIWDKQAIDLVKNHNWNVSCTYDFESDFIEKTHNGKKIDMEFTNGKFLHLALVNNPRYERANIVMNGKDKVENDRWITVHPNGEDEKGRPLLIKDGETPKEAMQRQWGADDGQQTLDFKGAKKAVKDAKIYQNKKEASKDKLYKAITDYWEDRTDANEKKLDEAEKEYEKYHDEKIKDYDKFIDDYEEKDEEKRAGQRYKEYVNKYYKQNAPSEEKENVSPKRPTFAKERLIEIDKNAEDKITDKDKWLEFTKEKAEILGDKIILGSSKILKKEDLEKMDDIKIQKLKNLYEKHNLFEDTLPHSQKVPKDYKDNVSHYGKDEHRKEIISLYKNIEENKNISEGRKKEDIEKIKYHLKKYEKYPDTSNVKFYGDDRTSEEQKIKEIKKRILKETKNNKAKNDINNIVANALAEVIVENCLGE